MSMTWFIVSFNGFAESMTIPPLGLSDNYVELNVFNVPLVPGTYEQRVEFMAQFFALVQNKEITILVETGSSTGVGLYDTQETYSAYPLLSGHHFDSTATELDQLLVNTNSYINSKLDDSMTYTVGNTVFTVAGIYNNLHPLAAVKGAEYICSLFHPQFIRDSDLSGRYLIDTPDKEFRNEIVAFFEEYGSFYSYQMSSGKPLGTLFKEFLLGTGFIVGNLKMMWMIVINYMVYFTLLYNTIWTHKKLASIGLHFGATKFKLFATFSKVMFLNLCLGILTGIGFYHLLMKVFIGDSSLTIQLALVAALINLVMVYLLFTLAFYSINFRIKEGEIA